MSEGPKAIEISSRIASVFMRANSQFAKTVLDVDLPRFRADTSASGRNGREILLTTSNHATELTMTTMRKVWWVLSEGPRRRRQRAAEAVEELKLSATEVAFLSGASTVEEAREFIATLAETYESSSLDRKEGVARNIDVMAPDELLPTKSQGQATVRRVFAEFARSEELDMYLRLARAQHGELVAMCREPEA